MADDGDVDRNPALPTKAIDGDALAWGPLIAACICNCAHFYSICSLFSFAGIMSADLGWSADRDHAGNIAGFLQSANVVGRVPTSALWGIFAQRYGLKASLCVAMTSLALGNFLFGFCTDSIVVTVLIRFVFLGMGSGWATFVAPLALEIGGSNRQAEVIGKVFASGTFIQLIGPAMSGWTYGLLPRFPAAVPGLLGAFIAISALYATCTRMHAPQLPTKPFPDNAPAESQTAKIVCTWPIPLIMMLRSIQGCMNFAFFELVPLWAISSIQLGGMALTEDELGVVLALSAVGSGLFMAFGLSPVHARLGLRKGIMIGGLVIMIGFMVVPFLSNLLSLIFVHTITNSAFGLMAAGYISTLNNVTPSDHRATVNGISVTCESVMKGIGPMLSSVSFASSLSSFGGGGRFVVFFVCAGIHAILVLGTFILPARVNSNNSAEKTKQTPCASASAPESSTIGAINDFLDRPAASQSDETKKASTEKQSTLRQNVAVHGMRFPLAEKVQKYPKYKLITKGLEVEPLKHGPNVGATVLYLK